MSKTTPHQDRSHVTEAEAWASPETIRTALGDIAGNSDSKRTRARNAATDYTESVHRTKFLEQLGSTMPPIRTIEDVFGQGTPEQNHEAGLARLQRLNQIAPDAGGIVGEVTQIQVVTPNGQAFHPEVHAEQPLVAPAGPNMHQAS